MSTSYWDADRLDRAVHSNLLIRFLEGRLAHRAAKGLPRAYVLNIDSPWGQGKTFFLKGLMADLRELGHVVAYVNAWESDFADQPLLATLTAIEDALEPYFVKREKLKAAWGTLVQSGGALAASLAKNVGAKIVQKYSGDFIEDVAEVLDMPAETNGDDSTGLDAVIEEAVDKLSDRALHALLGQFRKEAKSIDRFKSNMALLVKQLPVEPSQRFLFVLVDELDRCRPWYAIRLLEDAKHLFSVDGVVFVIATDTAQLVEGIRGLYGSSFDSSRYLLRFFDRTYRFPDPDRKGFIEFLFQRDEIDEAKVVVGSHVKLLEGCAAYFDSFESTLRDIEQCLDVLSTFVTLWPHPKLKIELGYALPLIILYQQSKMELFNILGGPSGHMPENFMKALPLWKDSRGRFDNYQETVISTRDLTIAFKSLIGTKLWEIGHSDSGATAYAQRTLSNEFHARTGGTYDPSKPMYSILNEYRKFVELSHRFEIAATSGIA